MCTDRGEEEFYQWLRDMVDHYEHESEAATTLLMQEKVMLKGAARSVLCRKNEDISTSLYTMAYYINDERKSNYIIFTNCSFHYATYFQETIEKDQVPEDPVAFYRRFNREKPKK
ncbi:MAG: hypothetical protein HRU26_15665 [Psychroserpens sp.]|nr:hypothetical protein [Psychroserpens sp.]